jgi:hypothetical protein
LHLGGVSGKKRAVSKPFTRIFDRGGSVFKDKKWEAGVNPPNYKQYINKI